MSGQAYRQMALAELANSTTFFGNPDMDRARRLALLEEGSEEAEAGQISTADMLLSSMSHTSTEGFYLGSGKAVYSAVYRCKGALWLQPRSIKGV